MTIVLQVDTVSTVSGDYFGVVYRGNPIVPLLLVLAIGAALWWLLKKRRRTR